MNEQQVVIVTHAVFVGEKDVFGPGTAVGNFLQLKKIRHVIIKHSLWDRRASVVEEYDKQGKKKIRFLLLPKYFPSPIRYLFEIISTLLYLKKNKTHVFVGVDPINGFAGILAKRFGLTDECIYYTADYAYDRFTNAILNNIYHCLDGFVIRNVTCVWNVSTKIQALRKKQGVPDKRNILIPNAPILALMPKVKKSPKFTHGIVLMANFPPAIDYQLILSGITILKKRFKDISIAFIGSGVRESQVREQVLRLRLEKQVRFFGFLAHEKALEVCSNYAVGLAVYANEWSWTQFGDSLKARECLAVGLPVIITNNVSTSDDIVKFKAGFSIALNEKTFITAIKKIFVNKITYNSFRKNAVQLAKAFDLEALLDKELIKKFNL